MNSNDKRDVSDEDVADDVVDEAAEDADDEMATDDLADDDVETAQDDYEEEAAVTVTATGDAAETVAESLAAAPATKKRGGLIAWIALLVSLAALAGIGYDYIGDRSAAGELAAADRAVADLSSTVASARDSLRALESRLAALEGQTTSEAEFQALRRQLESRLRDLEALPGRVSSVEGAISSLQGISTGARDAWLLAEAEYYMQIANAQLQLARNPQLAILALTLADERIQQLGDPRLTDVRRAVSNELRSLEVIERPDIAGISLTLASLASALDSLPLVQELPTRTENGDNIDGELSGMDRALATMKRAVGSVVTVRRVDEQMQPLIAPEAQYFLRANLALQLQAARLALLRGEQAIFEQSLDDAASWLRDYYDAESQGVMNALDTIAEIRDNVLSIETPDISQSLRLLRQFNALAAAENQARRQPARSRSNAPPPAEPSPQPVAGSPTEAVSQADAAPESEPAAPVQEDTSAAEPDNAPPQPDNEPPR